MNTKDVLFFTTLTLMIFWGSQRFEQQQQGAWFGKIAGLPLVASIVLIIGFLRVSDIAYARYFAATQIIHLMLGPATVSLAVPLYEQRQRVWHYRWPLLTALLAGCVTSMVLTWVIGKLLAVDRVVLLSCLPRSVTMPIALKLSEAYGGSASLTAAVVLLSGICGGVFLPLVLAGLGLAKGPKTATALGAAAHGVGVACAFAQQPATAPFASIAVALHGLIVSLLMTQLYRFLSPL